MRIAALNWMQVEEYLKRDDRCVLPLGSTEQHAYLSLATDAVLAERVAVEAAEPLGVPVFPVLPYGLSPYFQQFPGSVTLRVATYAAMLREVLDSLAGHGFRRILIVNGHGGNSPAQPLALEWMADHPQARVRFHDWWRAPRAWARVQAIDPVASHASWMENFPWTRLAGTVLPAGQKPMVNVARLRELPPAEVRATLGDGNYGGLYARSDEEMLSIWKEAVEETRELLAWKSQ
jgi:creatinine amidohydrolase